MASLIGLEWTWSMGKLVLKDEPLTHKGCLARCGKWVELTTVSGTDEQARTYTETHTGS